MSICVRVIFSWQRTLLFMVVEFGYVNGLGIKLLTEGAGVSVRPQ